MLPPLDLDKIDREEIWKMAYEKGLKDAERKCQRELEELHEQCMVECERIYYHTASPRAEDCRERIEKIPLRDKPRYDKVEFFNVLEKDMGYYRPEAVKILEYTEDEFGLKMSIASDGFRSMDHIDRYSIVESTLRKFKNVPYLRWCLCYTLEELEDLDYDGSFVELE